MSRFGDKLRDLLQVLNIPIQERWPEHAEADSIYTYWRGIGLLDASVEEQIKTGRTHLEPTRIIRRFFENVDYYWPPQAYAGRAAADMGSGFGHLTFWLLLSGAREVLSIGDSQRMSFVMRLHEAAVARGLLPKGSLIARGDLIRANDEELVPGRRKPWLRLVLMNDALEYINPRVRPSLFALCFAALEPRGLLISRQHNSDCPRVLARLRSIWKECEENRYLPVRRLELKRRLGELEPSLAEALAVGTRGQDSYAFAEAIEGFRRDRTVLPERPDTAPIDIRTDEVCEGWTGITMILNELRTAGFDAHTYPAMREGRRSAFLQPIARAMPAPFFRFHVFDDNTVFVGIKTVRGD